MKKLVVSIQKGGNGKTVTTLNVAHALGNLGYKVLVVDTDPQSNATQVCLKTDSMPTNSIAHIFTREENSTDLILKTHLHDKVFILPASPELSMVEYKSASSDPNAMALRRYLEQDEVDSFFDFCLIDTPSTLGFLMVAALKSGDHTLIPVKLDTFSYSVLPNFLDVLEDTQQFLSLKGIVGNNHLKPNLMCILPVAADMRLAESKYWKREFQVIYKELFWGGNIINSNAPTSAAIALNKTVFLYDNTARNCLQFTELAKRLAKEMIKYEQTK